MRQLGGTRPTISRRQHAAPPICDLAVFVLVFGSWACRLPFWRLVSRFRVQYWAVRSRRTRSVRPPRNQPSVCSSGESGDLRTDEARWLLVGHRRSCTLERRIPWRFVCSRAQLWGRTVTVHASGLVCGKTSGHLYLVNPRSTLKAYRPSTLFIEAEASSFSALQWGAAARSLQIPFGLQAAENLDRPLPVPVIADPRWLLAHARFVAARSPAAGELARAWGARGDVVLLPHAVPPWNVSRISSTVFTVGYAGRLVPEKGISDLVDACPCA